MVAWGARIRDRVEAWGELAFISVGVIWLAFVVLSVYEAQILQDYHRYQWVTQRMGSVGLLCMFVGLLGFYPKISAAAPRLARGGLGLSVVGLVALVVFRGTAIITSLSTGTPLSEVSTGLRWLYPVLMVTMLLAFLLYGVAVIRTNVPGVRVGGLLLVPPAALGIHGTALALGITDYILLRIGIIALAMLALGYVLRFDTPAATATDRTTTP